jgi:hypothetical protein
MLIFYMYGNILEIMATFLKNTGRHLNMPVKTHPMIDVLTK